MQRAMPPRARAAMPTILRPSLVMLALASSSLLLGARATTILPKTALMGSKEVTEVVESVSKPFENVMSATAAQFVGTPGEIATLAEPGLLKGNYTSLQLQECLALRMGETGAAKMNVGALIHRARRRLAEASSEDPSCTTKSPYIVLLDQFTTPTTIGGTRAAPLLEHNITNFKVLGASMGCFLASLDACTATKLSADPRIATAVPLDAAMKTSSFNLDKLLNASANAARLPGLDAANLTSDISAEAPEPPKVPDSVVLHVTLADGDDVLEKLALWKETLASEGLNTTSMDIQYSTSATSPLMVLSADDVAEPVRTRYMILSDVPAEAAARITQSLAEQKVVEYIEASPRLQFLNQYARGVTQSGDYQVTPLANMGLDGSGQIIGVADTGLDMNVCFLSDSQAPTPFNTVTQNHRKLVTYITYADNGENFDASQGSSDPIGHGTHVSSSVAGKTSGSMAAHNGMAHNAKLAFFDIAKYDKNGNVQLYPPGDLNSDMLSKLYSAGARIFSMSWGSPDSNCYSSYAVMVDEFMWNNPDALVIFAAGNSGSSGAYSVVTPSTAKSCLTVGASYNMMQTSFGLENNIKYVAYFSSIGPTADGRLKPDVVAPGYYIRSAHNAQTCGVVDSRGTSMATPVVAGNAALIRQYLMSGKYQNLPLRPSGALLKALLVHSAQKMTAYEDVNGKLTPLKWPDVHQGYGRIQDDQVIDRSGRYTLIAYGTHNASDPRYRVFTAEGDVHNYQLTISANTTKARALKVTLVWTDRPASAVSCQQTKTSVLINDLDLHVTDSSGKIFYPMATGGTEADRFNPVEQIVIPNPLAETNYTVTVTARGLVTTQNYALVISGRFAGFQYNETSADVGDSNFWGFVEGHSTAVVLICVAVLLSVCLCCCCLRRPGGAKRTAADLFDGPSAMMARVVGPAAAPPNNNNNNLLRLNPNQRGRGGSAHAESVL